MPVGLLVNVPPPDTLTERVLPFCMKVADTLFAALMVTTQLPVPLQAPPQPVKFQPFAGASLSVTWAPLAKFALQVEPQLMPDGELVTVPLPVSLTESVNSCVNVAVTDSARVHGHHAAAGSAACTAPAGESPTACGRSGQGDLRSAGEAGAAGRAATDPRGRAGHRAAAIHADAKCRFAAAAGRPVGDQVVDVDGADAGGEVPACRGAVGR